MQLLFNIIVILLITLAAFFAIYSSSIEKHSIFELCVKYFEWLKNVIVLDLGNTLYNMPVLDELIFPLLNTLKLTGLSLIFSISISLILGWYWSENEFSYRFNIFFNFLKMVSSIPIFIAAFLLANFTFYFLIDITEENISTFALFSYYALPVFCLSFFDGFFSELITFVKVQVESIKDKPFIRSLELLGGQSRRHIFAHIFVDLLKLLESKFAYLIGGAIVVEIIFNWDGLGYWGLEAVKKQDFNLFMGVLLITSLLIAIVRISLTVLRVYFNPVFRKEIMNRSN